MKKTIKQLSLLSLSTTIALGVNLPQSSTINKNIKVPKNIQKKKELIELDNLKTLEPLQDDKSGKSLLIKGFSFTGNTKLTNKQLNEALKEYKNKELNFQQMQNVAIIITKLYRDNGYFVARAYIPKQTLKDNILNIAIIEGKYGDLEIKNSSLLKDEILQNIFDEVKTNRVVSSLNLERVMLIANDTPGVIVSKADVKAGKKQGYSDFDIEVNKDANYDGYVLLDNLGSRYTGKHRLMAALNLNSPFQYGDKLSLTTLSSSGTNLKYANFAYNTLLAANGLRGGIEYTYSKYNLIKEYQNLDATGDSKVFKIDLSYPLIRQREHTLNTTLKLENKKNQDQVNSTNDTTDKELNILRLGAEYELNTFTGLFPTNYTLSSEYSYGNLSFKDNDSLSNDKAGANTNGNYSKLLFTVAQTINFNPKFDLETNFTYQHSLGNKNLDGSEDLSIGGLGGVRVYPSSEASGENGYIFSIEPKYTLPSLYNINSTLGIFYDRAKVYMADNSKVDTQAIDLQDIGISYYASYKEFFLNSYLAWKLNSDDVTSENDYNSKFLIQAGWVF